MAIGRLVTIESTRRYKESVRENKAAQKTNLQKDKAQHAKERTAFYEAKPCLASSLADLHSQLPNFKLGALEQLSKEEFYNPTIPAVVSCIINSVFLAAINSTNELDSKQGSYVREWFRDLHLVASGAYGQALTARVDGARDFFLLKTVQSGSDQSKDEVDSIYHEFFVATKGTNQLRSLIPNFTYLFGGWSCTAPLLGQGKYTAWCLPSPNGVPYLLYENIAPSVTLQDMLLKLQPDEILSIYLQLMFSVYIAETRIGFTHYDLHDSNVLIKDIPAGTLAYEVKSNQTYYLRTTHLAYIIDYGQANITYEGEQYGLRSLSRAGIYAQPFALFDAYKLYMMILRTLHSKRKGKAAFDYLAPIFSFWNEVDEIEDVLEATWSGRYFLPPTKKNLTFPFLKYIDWILDHYDVPFLDTQHDDAATDYPLFSCSPGGCMTIPAIVDKITGRPHFASVQQLSDYLDQNDISQQESIITTKALKSLIDKAMTQIERLTSDLEMSNPLPISFDESLLTASSSSQLLANVAAYSQTIIDYKLALVGLIEVTHALRSILNKLRVRNKQDILQQLPSNEALRDYLTQYDVIRNDWLSLAEQVSTQLPSRLKERAREKWLVMLSQYRGQIMANVAS